MIIFEKNMVDGSQYKETFNSNKDFIDDFISPDTNPPVSVFRLKFSDNKTGKTISIIISNSNKTELFIKENDPNGEENILINF